MAHRAIADQLHLATIATPHGSFSGPRTAPTPTGAPTYPARPYARPRAASGPVWAIVGPVHQPPGITPTIPIRRGIANTHRHQGHRHQSHTAGGQPIVMEVTISPSITTRSQS